MKKKFFLTLLALVCALCCAFSLAACDNGNTENNGNTSTENNGNTNTENNGSSNTDFEFSLTDDGNYAVKLNNKNAVQITIPSTYDGKPVTEIIQYGFNDCTKLTSVNIPDSITEIGRSAFNNCSSLTSVTVGNGVTSIGNNAFQNCTSLTSITIGNGVTSIGTAVFHTCTSLTSITLPNSVTSIGGFAFYKCSALTSITIPNSVTSIGEDVFYGCSSLTSVTVGNGVTSIGIRAFDSCTSLMNITIPDSVTEIGDGSFQNCTSLTSITIGNGVTSIGGNMTFYGCRTLESILVSENNTVYASQDGILYNKAKTEFVHIPKAIKGAITIPDSITEIGANAFNGCTALESVTIPDSITEIGNWAFDGCDNLTEVKASVSILNYLKISTDAERIKSIKSLVLTCNDEIEEGLLNGFGKLESLTLPFIGKKATNNVLDRTNVLGYIFGTTEYVGGVQTTQVYNRSSTTTIDQTETYYIPESLKSVTVLGGEISYGAVSNCSNIESVTLPADLTTIETRAFQNCTSLKSIVIPDSVVTIGANSFEYCTALKTVIIGNGVNTVSSFAFKSSGVETLIINKVSTIEQGAFDSCLYLENVYYALTSENWQNVNISAQNNSYLTNATLYCSGEWEYVDGVPTVKA